ncbi:hypothetical protein ABB07_00815 [Streptomyces incarnatus]|uniref:Leucine-binding protein domain-containing protein n=1 Tax=Streptomyces incarnatus TaxID=665007 RepID=A0ABM5TCF0_9ACTN|nr:hypothetical protein [Streptomyces incarnatus]AKJ08632.1 hypothetical protein ABB07_00815 [Streptomyces incarnatus]
MLHPPPEDAQRLVLPNGFDAVVRVLDRYVADRRAGLPWRVRSRGRRLPAVLLARAPEGDPAAGTAEPDPALAALVLAYGQRLLSTGHEPVQHLAGLAPHAVVDDALLARGGPREDEAGGPHVLLLDEVARQLRTSMPDGAGALRLREFGTLLAVLRAPLPPEDDTEGGRKALRDMLVDREARRFQPAPGAAQLGEAVGGPWATAVRWVTAVPAGWLWRLWYGIRVDRQQPWLGSRLDQPGRSFLDAALALRAAHQYSRAHGTAQTRTPESAAMAARDEAVVRQVLLIALIHDLARAARPPAWSRRRPRRGWSFVVLLPTVGAEGSACRKFLDTYAATAGDAGPSPLLVLGAATDDIPSYAAPPPPPQAVPAQSGARAHRAGGAVAALFSAATAGRSTEAVHVLPLPRTPDDGTAAEWLAGHRVVRTRRAGAWDWWRPVAAALAATLLCAGGFAGYRTALSVLPGGRSAASCRQVATGQVVGLTDGNDGCDLAHGLYAPELRKLERTLGRQNALVDTDGPYRTLVFFAPLSVGSESKRTVPTGFQMLRGALLAQKEVNDRHLKSQVPVRLLVANAGEYFRYGSSGGLNTTNHTNVDVAQMILDRAGSDHIAAVMGLTQSRPESQQATIELGAKGLAVLGTGVTGQRMVEGESPVSYFQLSPPDARIASVMAAFAQHSPRLGALAKPTAGHTAPAAVVVYDPSDKYFSNDLANRFDTDYHAAGPVYRVPYGEVDDRRTSDVAQTVCALVHRTNGFVLYAGRSGVMEDLFHYMQGDPGCRARQNRVAVMAESPAPELTLHPERMQQEYGALTLFYNQFSLPDPQGPFAGLFQAAFQLSAENDAAVGYDAVNVLSDVMDAIFTTDPEFTPSSLVTQLQDPGVSQYVGESGVITLNSDHNYPPDKEIHVREIPPNGKPLTDLTCGVLAKGAQRVTHWGPDGRFPCPTDDAS